METKIQEISDDSLNEMLIKFKLFDDDEYDLNFEISNRTLSSGQMQKISFIRALLADTELLLLDESTSNLDAETRNLIFSILKNQNITIINSTIIMRNSTMTALRIEYEGELRIFNYLK